MRKKSKKQQSKARQQQQRETIKNLHRKLNDMQIQVNTLQGMRDAHLDELSRVATTREKEVTARYQPQIEQLKGQLQDKDARLSKDAAELQAGRKEVQELRQQVTDQANKLAVVSARNAAHGEELERVRKETEERTTATYQKQLADANEKVEKALAAEKAFKERMAKGQEMAAAYKKSAARGRPKKGVKPMNISLSAITKDKIDLLRNVKLVTYGGVSKACEEFLEGWLEPKMEEFRDMITKGLPEESM